MAKFLKGAKKRVAQFALNFVLDKVDEAFVRDALLNMLDGLAERCRGDGDTVGCRVVERARSIIESIGDDNE